MGRSAPCGRRCCGARAVLVPTASGWEKHCCGAESEIERGAPRIGSRTCLLAVTAGWRYSLRGGEDMDTALAWEAHTRTLGAQLVLPRVPSDLVPRAALLARLEAGL